MKAKAEKTDRGQLTFGPIFFNWEPETTRDFYFRIADEAPVDSVCLGEVICPKRSPNAAKTLVDAAERLARAGKEVVHSTLALVLDEIDMDRVNLIAGDDNLFVEANDTAALAVLDGRPHVVGPFINVYNECTLGHLEKRGAKRVCLPVELGRESLAVLAGAAKADLEVQVFGRIPLALSARCYHARAYDLQKDGCQFVCAKDPDGLLVETLADEPCFAVNGIQTLSETYCNLIRELDDMRSLGIHRFRLSPHDIDMVAVAQTFRDVLDGALATEAAARCLTEMVPDARFANGYYHGQEGLAWVGKAAAPPA